MTATWLGDVLRAAGLKVVEHDGWKTRSHGEFTELHSVVWHHDGSPVGDSPGVPAFMIRNWNTASANCWVALDGTWHLIGAGVAYHAGTVLPGKPGNHSSIGVETDHTTGETWSGVFLLESLRRGTAAILRRIGTTTGGLEFHKTICSPPGRKTDPDGLDLATEREAVHTLLTSHQETDVFQPYVVDIPAPDVTQHNRQIIGHDINNKHFGTNHDQATAQIRADDNGVRVPAQVQPYDFNGELALSFFGLDGGEAPQRRVIVIIGRPG